MYEIFERLLKEKGLTAYRVAKDTGVTTATLTSWKQGKYTPKAEKLQKIADYLGVTVDYLKGENTDEKKELDLAYASAVIDFAEPEEAVKFILSQPALMSYGGYDLKNMSDDEILEVANDMLLALRISLEKQKRNK